MEADDNKLVPFLKSEIFNIKLMIAQYKRTAGREIHTNVSPPS